MDHLTNDDFDITDDPRDGFRMSIGGYGDHFRVVVREGTSLYGHWSFGDEPVGVATVATSADAWQGFVRVLDRVEFRQWHRTYEPESTILDGTSWSVVARLDGVVHESRGSNAYPERWGLLVRVIRRGFGGRPLY